MPDGPFHAPRLEPLSEHGLLPGDVGQPPVMAQLVDTRGPVAFADPLGAGFATEHRQALVDRLSGGSLAPKPTGVPVPGRFRDGVHGEQIQHLPGPVRHRGDAEGAFLAMAFGEVHAPQRASPVAPLLERGNRRVFLRRAIPDDAIDPRRALALVVGHSPHREGLGAERVGQQSVVEL